MARRAVAVSLFLLMSIALSGCEYVFGVPDPGTVDLFNPVTRTHVLCAGDPGSIVPSRWAVFDQQACISRYAALGYHVVGAIDRPGS